MSTRIIPPPVSDSGSIVHTRILLEIFLHVYALGTAIVLVRTTLRLFGVTENLWVTTLLDQAVLPVIFVLDRIPGGNVGILGPLTLADATLIAGVIVVPLALVARGRSPRPRVTA